MTVKPIYILLADDDTDDCHFFKLALQEMPIVTNFTAVLDGEKVMQFLTNENNQLPDVIFLDLNMPRKNGFECLSEIKANPKLNHLPVIIFSTSLEQEMVTLLYTNGAHYFIRKPSDFIQFKKIIQHLFLTHDVSKDLHRPNEEDFVITANTLNLL